MADPAIKAALEAADAPSRKRWGLAWGAIAMADTYTDASGVRWVWRRGAWRKAARRLKPIKAKRGKRNG